MLNKAEMNWRRGNVVLPKDGTPRWVVIILLAGLVACFLLVGWIEGAYAEGEEFELPALERVVSEEMLVIRADWDAKTLHVMDGMEDIWVMSSVAFGPQMKRGAIVRVCQTLVKEHCNESGVCTYMVSDTHVCK